MGDLDWLWPRTKRVTAAHGSNVSMRYSPTAVLVIKRCVTRTSNRLTMAPMKVGVYSCS